MEWPITRRPRRSLRRKASARITIPFLEEFERRELLSTAAGFLQGTVLSTTGSPVVGAIVNLYAVPSPSPTPTPIASVTTGSDGTYSFNNLTPGNYSIVEVPPTGYANSSTSTNSPLNPVSSTTSSTINVQVSDLTNLTVTYNAADEGARVAGGITLKASNDGGTTYSTIKTPIGQAPITVTGPNGLNTGLISSFCVDLFSDLTSQDTFGATGQPVPPNPNSSPNAGRIAYLYNHYGTILNTPLSSSSQTPSGNQLTFGQSQQALQLAIWKLEYDTGANLTNWSAGNLQVVAPFNGGNTIGGFPIYNPSDSDATTIEGLADTYITESAGHSELAVMLQPNLDSIPAGQGYQDMLAPGYLNFTNQYQPSITTTQGPASAVVGSGAINDTAHLSGLVNPVTGAGAGTITFRLTGPGNTVVDTETVNNVSANGDYTTPTGYTPTVAGTYYWVATYSGDANNAGVASGATDEPVVVTMAGPAISTTPTPTSEAVSGSTLLTDTATLSGGYNPTGSITFTLVGPGNSTFYTTTVTVNGNGQYSATTTSVPTVAGTYQWNAVYTGDTNNAGASDLSNSNEQVTITAPPPGQDVAAGDFATIGFWHNKNGQAVIESFNGGRNSTQLGSWLATNFPNLFGSRSPFLAGSLAGLTNAQVAEAYANLWTPSGVTKNTYVQAFAVALGIYADTSSLGGGSSTARKYGFNSTAAGGGADVYNVGSNGSAFGVADNSSLTVLTILQDIDQNFDPLSGTFYGDSQSNTSAANNVLNGINTKGDIG